MSDAAPVMRIVEPAHGGRDTPTTLQFSTRIMFGWGAYPCDGSVFIAPSSTLANSRGASYWTMWPHWSSWNVQPGSVRVRSADGPIIGAGGFEQYTKVLGNAAASGLAR
jgi:hypothetical protein